MSRAAIAFTRATGAISLLAWTYLLLFRGRFWRIRDESVPLGPAAARRVAAIVPARNEAAVISETVESLAVQDAPGEFRAYIVDDQSDDGTAERARDAVAACGASDRITIIRGRPLPPGWTGKLWAVSQGIDAARLWRPDYLLLTDADIRHAPDTIRSLVARSEMNGLDLASYMVRLHCEGLAESALIPAFVFFFLKLYPPSSVADPSSRLAGAAGGCMLLRTSALDRIGGIGSIRGEIIDDCALANAVKSSGGRIWMGLTAPTYSTRQYRGFAEIWNMIARTAFTQLRHSVVLLAGTVVGMGVLYVLPAALLFSRDKPSIRLGGAAWAVMTAAYAPTVRFYRKPLFWAAALPLAAVFYTAATIDSAVRYWRGRGGEWKGRLQDRNGTA